MKTNTGDENGDNGWGAPVKPKTIMDEDGEEVTRKIAPTMIMPSLGPLPTMPPTSRALRSARMTKLLEARKPKLLDSSKYKLKGFDKESWSWTHSHVPVLPESHNLERTSAFIPNANPIKVAAGISDVLRQRSIEAHYENGKAKVKCTTVEGVDFLVHLYRGRGRYSHGIIVEVRRMFGTSYVFHNDTQAIFDGAQGKTRAPLASNNLPKVSDGDQESEDTPSSASSLEMVAKMMRLPGFDSQYLGLQMLSPLVTAERLSPSMARAVASSLLNDDSEVGLKVLNYIIKDINTTGKKETTPDVFEDDDEDEGDDENFMILRNLSLGIIANALKAHRRVPEHLRSALRPVLLRDLWAAEKHPNTALFSAYCSEFFIEEDDGELNKALEFAKMVGEDRHAKLWRQTQKCMNLFDRIKVR